MNIHTLFMVVLAYIANSILWAVVGYYHGKRFAQAIHDDLATLKESIRVHVPEDKTHG